jgi:hypothetical protein
VAATALDILRQRARNEREAWNEEASAAFFAAAEDHSIDDDHSTHAVATTASGPGSSS